MLVPVENAVNDTSNWGNRCMRVLLVLLLAALALVEYFYHYAANLQSVSSADGTQQEKPAGMRRPPDQDHHSH